MKYRLNVTNWRGDDSALQVTNGEIVLQSHGWIEDTFATREDAERAIREMEIPNTCVVAVFRT